jgi:glycosyltransferase involved in cell wall biosynthesis
MRIAVVAGPYIPVPPLAYGGTEAIIHHQINGLKEAGHTPILLGPGDSTAECEVIPTCEQSIYFPLSRKNLKQHQKLVEGINRQTKKQLSRLVSSIDIIHSHGFDLSSFSDFPGITTIHGPIDLNGLGYYLKRRKLLYVTVSKNQQEALPLLNYIGTVYNGEDPRKFTLVQQPDDYVSFLGRFDREKNPHLAIQLAISLGIKIKLAGKIDYQAEGYFDEAIRPYLKHPLVEFLGEIGFKEKIELLSHARCNLHPTGFREPFGLDVLEAAYCGTPTLAIDRGSMPELIEDGRTGILVEDFVEGYHQIEQCFAMDRKYISTRAKTLFNYTNMTAGYIEIYNRILRAYPERTMTRHTAWRRLPQIQTQLGLTPPIRQEALSSAKKPVA